MRSRRNFFFFLLRVIFIQNMASNNKKNKRTKDAKITSQNESYVNAKNYHKLETKKWQIGGA